MRLGKHRPEILARRTDPQTSKDAAVQLDEGRRQSMKLTILETMAGDGSMTADEVADLNGWGPERGSWKRLSDLKNESLVAPTTQYRMGRSGRMQQVYEITSAGREYLNQRGFS